MASITELSFDNAPYSGDIPADGTSSIPRICIEGADYVRFVLVETPFFFDGGVLKADKLHLTWSVNGAPPADAAVYDIALSPVYIDPGIISTLTGKRYAGVVYLSGTSMYYKIVDAFNGDVVQSGSYACGVGSPGVSNVFLGECRYHDRLTVTEQTGSTLHVKTIDPTGVTDRGTVTLGSPLGDYATVMWFNGYLLIADGYYRVVKMATAEEASMSGSLFSFFYRAGHVSIDSGDGTKSAHILLNDSSIAFLFDHPAPYDHMNVVEGGSLGIQSTYEAITGIVSGPESGVRGHEGDAMSSGNRDGICDYRVFNSAAQEEHRVKPLKVQYSDAPGDGRWYPSSIYMPTTKTYVPVSISAPSDGSMFADGVNQAGVTRVSLLPGAVPFNVPYVWVRMVSFGDYGPVVHVHAFDGKLMHLLRDGPAITSKVLYLFEDGLRALIWMRDVATGPVGDTVSVVRVEVVTDFWNLNSAELFEEQ